MAVGRRVARRSTLRDGGGDRRPARALPRATAARRYASRRVHVDEVVRAVDFTIAYEVRPSGAPLDSPPAIVASTQIATFDIDTQRLRRLTSAEREYLQSWQASA